MSAVTAPILATASHVTTYSGRFSMKRATTSPLRTPVEVSQWARRLLCRSTSPNDISRPSNTNMGREGSLAATRSNRSAEVTSFRTLESTAIFTCASCHSCRRSDAR